MFKKQRSTKLHRVVKKRRTELYMLNASGVFKKAKEDKIAYVERLSSGQKGKEAGFDISAPVITGHPWSSPGHPQGGHQVIRSSLGHPQGGHQFVRSSSQRSSGHQVILTEVIRSSGHHLVNHKVITFADLWRSRKQRRTNCIC